MCNHVLAYPDDIRENYNPDGKTLTGICKKCGMEKIAYGMRWAIPIEESFLKQIPYGETIFEDIDKTKIIC